MPKKQQYSPSNPFQFPSIPTWKAPPRRINDWAHNARIAQIQALALIHDLFENQHHIPVLEHPWSDALYPSIVKVWGIDYLNEEPALYLDQVWLQRSHPDRPQQWVVVATTTNNHPLTYLELPDGTCVDEGTRAYLEHTLLELQTHYEKYVQDLSATLKNALATGQLRYYHLHSAYDPKTQKWEIDQLYEFPIYPAVYNKTLDDEALDQSEE